MKKILSIISVLSLFLLYSCEKNVITYNKTDLDENQFAQIRLVYDLPTVTNTVHNITRLKYNDQLYSEVGTPLGSIFPNSMAKYHKIPVGANKVDAYKSATKDVLAYSSNFTIEKGKWSAFIYNETQPPFMVQDPEEYDSGHPWADTLAYVRFVNLFHKADGVTPYGQLTLKVLRVVNGADVWVDVATCGFKEASTYNPIKLNRKGIAIWSGTESSMQFALYDSNGVPLQYFASTSAKTKTDHKVTGYSLTKGVNYIFHLNGKEGDNYAGQSIRVSTISVK